MLTAVIQFRQERKKMDKSWTFLKVRQHRLWFKRINKPHPYIHTRTYTGISTHICETNKIDNGKVVRLGGVTKQHKFALKEYYTR